MKLSALHPGNEYRTRFGVARVIRLRVIPQTLSKPDAFGFRTIIRQRTVIDVVMIQSGFTRELFLCDFIAPVAR